jgi:hypothetical protein
VADPLAGFLKLAGFRRDGDRGLLFAGLSGAARHAGGEYYVLCLTALLGIFVLISANSLLTVYLGIELLSLSLYAMVAFDRDSGIAAEAAIKYFVLGAIASGVLLYGMSMLYGLTGTLDLDQLSRSCARARMPADHRRRVRGGRDRLQIRRGAIPHVGARRLSGRPDQRDAVHRHGRQISARLR